MGTLRVMGMILEPHISKRCRSKRRRWIYYGQKILSKRKMKSKCRLQNIRANKQKEKEPLGGKYRNPLVVTKFRENQLEKMIARCNVREDQDS